MANPQATPYQPGIWPDAPAHPAAHGDQKDVIRRRARRASHRDIHIPDIAEPTRRAACEVDLLKFYETYFPESFYLPWSDEHYAAIPILQDVITNGNKITIVGPRGDGKTTRARLALAYAILYGYRKFPFLLCDTFGNALRNMKAVRRIFETNDHLTADFPGPCTCARALQGVYNRAAGQTVNGEPTYIQFGGGADNIIIMPTITGDKSSGAVIGFSGMDGSPRGLNHTRPNGETIRPDLLFCDDPQERKHAKNPLIVAARKQTILSDILGMAGPDQSMAAIYAGTIIVRNDMTDQFSDPEIHPDWQGRRYPLMRAMPTDTDQWDTYKKLHKQSLKKYRDIRLATQHYKANRTAMDAGADPTWVHRYDKKKEISATQFAMNILIERGEETFLTEFQNTPPDPQQQSAFALSAHQIETQTINLPRGHLPENTLVLALGADINKFGIHWIIGACAPGRIVTLIDYGIQPVNSPSGRISPKDKKKIRDLDTAITDGLKRLHDKLITEPYQTKSGQPATIDLHHYDCGWRTETVRAWCQTTGPQHLPIQGCGSQRNQPRYYHPKEKNVTITRDGNLYHKRDHKNRPCHYAHADAYKQICHSGFLLSPDQPGSLALFKPEHRTTHQNLADQITAEILIETDSGKPIWEKIKGRPDNHYLDATCYMLASLSVLEHTHPAIAINADPQAPTQPRGFKKHKRTIIQQEI